MSGLSGKVAIAKGAARGIGLAVARRLVAEGARVCLVDRDGQHATDHIRINAVAPGAIDRKLVHDSKHDSRRIGALVRGETEDVAVRSARNA